MSGELIIILWTIVVIGSLIFYLKNSWPRFFLPTVSVIAILQAYAVTVIIQALTAKIKNNYFNN